MRACKIDQYCKNRLVLLAPLFTMFLSFHHVHRIACQSSLCFVSLPLILFRASFESVSGIGSPHRSRPSSSQAARTPLHIIARVYVIVCGHVVDVFVTAVHAYSFGLLSCVRMRLRLRLLLLLLQLQLRFVVLCQAATATAAAASATATATATATTTTTTTTTTILLLY